MILAGLNQSTVTPRLTSDPANEFFGNEVSLAVFGLGYRIWIRLTNVLVDARANIKQQT